MENVSMAYGMVGEAKAGEFERLHKVFVEHLGFATAIAWASAIVAAFHCPWVSNIRGLIDPMGRQESTSSFLFALPTVMLVGWIAMVFGGPMLRRAQMLKNQTLEFAIAGAVAFGMFYLAVDRAATAFLLGF